MKFNVYNLIFYFSLLNASFINAQTLSNSETEFVNKMIEALPEYYLSSKSNKELLISAKKEFSNNGITLDSGLHLGIYLDLCSKIKTFENRHFYLSGCYLQEKANSPSFVEIELKLNSIGIDLFDQNDFTSLWGAFQMVLHNTNNMYKCGFFGFIHEYSDTSKLYDYKKFELSEILKTSDEFYKNPMINLSLPSFEYCHLDEGLDATISWMREYVFFYLYHVNGISKPEYFELIDLMSLVHEKESEEIYRKAQEERRKEAAKELKYLKENKEKILKRELAEIVKCGEIPKNNLSYLRKELVKDMNEEKQMEQEYIDITGKSYPHHMRKYYTASSDGTRELMDDAMERLRACGSYDRSVSRIDKRISELEKITKNQ